jgi:Fic family protein
MENWEGWILYILKGVEQTAQKSIIQVNEISRLFVNTQEFVKKNAPKIYSKELIELLFEHTYCKSEYLINRFGISRITASKYLKELEKIQVLQSRKVWKETLYINTQLFDLLKNNF